MDDDSNVEHLDASILKKLGPHCLNKQVESRHETNDSVMDAYLLPYL